MASDCSVDPLGRANLVLVVRPVPVLSWQVSICSMDAIKHYFRTLMVSARASQAIGV